MQIRGVLIADGTSATSVLCFILFVFLCKPLDGSEIAETPSHAAEVLDARWFAEHDLPDNLDPGHATRIPKAFHAWRGDGCAYFDE